MSTSPLNTIEKLLNVLRPTTPEQEQLAAVRALDRVMQSHETTWHDLLYPRPTHTQRSSPQSPSQPTPTRPTTAVLPWRMVVRQLFISPEYLTPWEREFLPSLLRFQQLTDKQKRCLDKVNDRVRGERT